jgi:prepilin-type N-terminal cleavage/methylation domain-containing protein
MRISRGRRGFTIIELLVVMAIILVLLGILVPTITHIRVAERAVACQANVRTLMQGIMAFAADNNGRLPGNQGTASSSYPPNEQDFLFGSSTGTSTTIGLAPQSGTLFPYVNNNYNVYLCPALQALDGAGGSGTASFASNGRFDYALFGVWAGASMRGIAPTSQMYWPDGHFDTLPTPILVQEAANEVDGPNQEGCHSNVDLISHAHFGGSYYGAIDGSIQFVIESPGNPNYSGNPGCWVWASRGPSSGKMQTMASTNPGWGFWDTQ